MRKKKDIVLKVEKLIFPNLAEGIYNDKKVRVKNAIPGQILRVVLGKNRREYRDAKQIEIIERSILETNEPCHAFEKCGGCNYQTLPLDIELEMKKQAISELFSENAGDYEIIVHENPKPFGYRNKMEYTFGDEIKDGPLVLGLHRKGKYYEIVDTTGCNIVHRDFEIIRSSVMEYFSRIGKKHYRKMSAQGFLRHLVIRCGFNTKELMVNLVTTTQDSMDYEEFKDILLNLELENEIVSILHTKNDDPADAVKSDETLILFGRDYIFEEVLGLRFKISAFSFFQPNVFGIEILYSRVLELAGNLEDITAYDLYSGTGTISQILAKKAKKVIGVEIVEEAVEAAKVNAELNGIKNVEFRANDVLKELEDLSGAPELIVLDPPRSGINPKALEKILDFNPVKFIYISCNPKTLAADFNSFIDRGYTLKNLELFDQFTRTYHVEMVGVFEKIKGIKIKDLKTKEMVSE